MSLAGRAIAVLSVPDYQELEFWYPVLRAREEGAEVTVVDDQPRESHLGYPVVPDQGPHEADAARIDAVVIAGAVMGEASLSAAQWTFIKDAAAAGAIVAAIGSGAAALSSELPDLAAGTRSILGGGPDDLPAFFRRLSDALTVSGDQTDDVSSAAPHAG
jgi:protease I